MFYLRGIKRADNTTSSGIKLNSEHSGKIGELEGIRHSDTMGKRRKKIIHRGNKKHKVFQWFYLHLIVVFPFTTQSTSFTSVAFFCFHEQGFIQLSKFKMECQLGVLTLYFQKHSQTLCLTTGLSKAPRVVFNVKDYLDLFWFL